MTAPATRRIWPERLHPTPDLIRPGHTIILEPSFRVTVTGIGWAHSDGTTVCSALDTAHRSLLIAWNPTDRRWHRQPWTDTRSHPGAAS
jgi:hypothetical protein